MRAQMSHIRYTHVFVAGLVKHLLLQRQRSIALLSSLMLFKCLFKDACVHVLLKRQLLEACLCLTCEQVKLCAVYECLFRYI